MSNESAFADTQYPDDPAVDEFCRIVAGIVRRLIVSGPTGQPQADIPHGSPTTDVVSTGLMAAEP